MSNFQCEECGMTNIDCGKDGFKTPRELELEARVKELEEKLTAEENKNFELREEIKELKDLNRRLDNQREEYWKGYLKLDKKLGIAERTLKDIATFEDNIIAREDAQQTLQKMEEV